ncbi:MAG: zf-HC2 domain-containing protein [Actinobacteria bacterium]|nr:zf-HC2 domain-containing protein [Actinomycetota bacterium]
MCYDEGTLQAYLDRELPGRKRWEIEAHIVTCDECRGRLEVIKEANKAALSSLSALSQGLYSQGISTGTAWMRLTRDERFGVPVKEKGVLNMVNTRLKTVLVPLAVAAVLATSFSFAPVREAAAEFLNIFRVEKVKTIDLTLADMRELEKLSYGDGGRVDIKDFGTVEMDGFKPSVPISIKGAKEAVDFKLRLPDQIKGHGDPYFKVQHGGTSNFTLDVDKVNSLIKSLGGEDLLPAALDGKKFTAKMPTVVIAHYPKDSSRGDYYGPNEITIAQARSPELIFPEGVDPTVVRDALLGLPMLPYNIKEQLEAVTDWRRTLLIPNIDGSAENVKVDGVDGVFVRDPKEVRGGVNALVWQKDGIVYGIVGDAIDLATAQEIAGSMR